MHVCLGSVPMCMCGLYSTYSVSAPCAGPWDCGNLFFYTLKSSQEKNVKHYIKMTQGKGPKNTECDWLKWSERRSRFM